MVHNLHNNFLDKKSLLGGDDHDYALHSKPLLGGGDHDYVPHGKTLIGGGKPHGPRVAETSNTKPLLNAKVVEIFDNKYMHVQFMYKLINGKLT